MKLRVALIGCGKIAQRHAEIISQLDSAELVSVADPLADKAKTLGEKYNVPFYTDFVQMLEEEEIDVADICTPSGTHGEIALKIIEKFSKHVIVEKPTALLLQEAQYVTKQAREKGLFFITVFQNRFNIPVLKLKEVMNNGRIGKVVIASARLYWCRKQDYYDTTPYRGTWAMDGGVLANQACHCVDMLQWLVGPVESVYAKWTTRLMKMEADDTTIVILKYKNGALGSIEATVCSRPSDIGCFLLIMGEKGTVELIGPAMNKLNRWMFENPSPEDEETMEKYKENPPDPVGFAHRQYLKHAFECIASGGRKCHPALALWEEGYRSLEIIQAAYESAERGEEIKLPFTPEKSKLGIKQS